jgi:ssDNA-binding Zn-finger/Zn-ribbon topoisomerase 1
MNRCKCGRRISKYASQCRICHQKMLEAGAKEYVEIWKKGTCPRCGRPLVFNNSLAGSMWLQCQGFGMLKPNPTDPDCGFQILADRDEVAKVRQCRLVSVPE